MNRKLHVGLTLFGGVLALLCLMPMSNPCLLSVDRMTGPVETAAHNGGPFGLVACDSFGPVAPAWLLMLAYLLVFVGVGALLGRSAQNLRWLIAGFGAAATLLLAFVTGKLVYPWLEVYWVTAGDLIILLPVTFVFGVIGSWLSSLMRTRGTN